MRTFELFIDILQKVEVQAENIEQAKQILEQQLDAQARQMNGVWNIVVPVEKEN